MQRTEPLQKALYAEMLGRIKEDDRSVPVRIGEYLYYYRMEKGRSYAIHCRKRGDETAPEEVFPKSEAFRLFEIDRARIAEARETYSFLADRHADYRALGVVSAPAVKR